MSLRLQGGVAIVTGGASGIGRALCVELAAAGARVVVADVAGDAAEEVARALRDEGRRAEAATVDVRDAGAVRALVERVGRDEGRLDYVFNNAGIGIIGEALDMTLADWERTIDVNLRGVIHGLLPAYVLMARQGFGHIVNTGSVAGLMPTPGMSAYSTTKHAVVGLSVSLRAEAALHGVRVSVVCPGFIDTPMKEHVEIKNLDRATMIGSLPIPFYAAKACARDILRGVRRNDPVIVTPAHAKALAVGYRLAPGLVSWLFGEAVKRTRATARVSD